jgi:hypothetical protein
MTEPTVAKPAAALERPFMFRPQIGPAILTDEMVEYLNDMARELGVTFSEAYSREMAAREELARITPSYEEAVRLAKLSPAPQEWYDE